MQKDNPEQLSELEREYYRETWGFDPLTDRKILRFVKNFLLSIVGKVEEDVTEEEQKLIALETKNAGSYYYEATFSLDADPGLQNIGVVIAARVEMYEDRTFHNYIVFRQGPRLTRVDCVHTIICQYPSMRENLSFPKDLLGEMSSTESRPAILPPWEHFAALKSYVGGIAATGLKNILIATYAGEDASALLLPFGFNALMQKQVLSALRALSPAAAFAIAQDVIGQLLEIKSGEWIRANYEELDEIWDIETIGRSSAYLFIPLDAALHSPEFRIAAEISPDTHPDVIKYLQRNSASVQSNIIPSKFQKEHIEQEFHENLPFRVSIEAKIQSPDSKIDDAVTSTITDAVLEQYFHDRNGIIFTRSWVHMGLDRKGMIFCSTLSILFDVIILNNFPESNFAFVFDILIALLGLAIVGVFSRGKFIGTGESFILFCFSYFHLLVVYGGQIGLDLGGSISLCIWGFIPQVFIRLQLSRAGIQYRTVFKLRSCQWQAISSIETIQGQKSESDSIEIWINNETRFHIRRWRELRSKNSPLELSVVSLLCSFKKWVDHSLVKPGKPI